MRTMNLLSILCFTALAGCATVPPTMVAPATAVAPSLIETLPSPQVMYAGGSATQEQVVKASSAKGYFNFFLDMTAPNPRANSRIYNIVPEQEQSKVSIYHDAGITIVDVDETFRTFNCNFDITSSSGFYPGGCGGTPKPGYLHRFVINDKTETLVGLSYDRYFSGKTAMAWITPVPGWKSMTDKELAGTMITKTVNMGNRWKQIRNAKEGKDLCNNDYAIKLLSDSFNDRENRKDPLVSSSDNLFCYLSETDRAGFAAFVEKDVVGAAKAVTSDMVKSLNLKKAAIK